MQNLFKTRSGLWFVAIVLALLTFFGGYIVGRGASTGKPMSLEEHAQDVKTKFQEFEARYLDGAVPPKKEEKKDATKKDSSKQVHPPQNRDPGIPSGISDSKIKGGVPGSAPPDLDAFQ